MGRCLEFALATFVITLVNAALAIWIGNLVANKITELFDQVIQALNFM